MAGEASEARRRDEWGPVRRGFHVLLPGGERGRIDDIHLHDGGVELVVTTGLFVRRLVRVDGAKIEAILPSARRVIVGGSDGAVSAEDAVPDLDVLGGIVRLPLRHSSRIGSAPEDSA